MRIFVAYWDGEKHVFIGTGFLVGQLLPDTTESFIYVVTAKHLVEVCERCSKDLSLYLRFNSAETGATWIQTPIQAWISHPSETNVDVAVMENPFDNFGPDIDHYFWPLEESQVGLNDNINGEKIETGDEVFIVGLFGHHIGNSKNWPLVRIGNIAAGPDEPITNLQWAAEMEAILI